MTPKRRSELALIIARDHLRRGPRELQTAEMRRQLAEVASAGLEAVEEEMDRALNPPKKKRSKKRKG